MEMEMKMEMKGFGGEEKVTIRLGLNCCLGE